MRTLLLVSVLAALAACSDSQQPTAPNARSARTASGDVGPSTKGIIIPQAKPQPAPTGFTKVTVDSADAYAPAGNVALQLVNCPAGSTVISGGFVTTSFGNVLAPPQVTMNYPYNNSWVVRFDNRMAGAMGMGFRVYAVCVS